MLKEYFIKFNRKFKFKYVLSSWSIYKKKSVMIILMNTRLSKIKISKICCKIEQINILIYIMI